MRRRTDLQLEAPSASALGLAPGGLEGRDDVGGTATGGSVRTRTT